MKLLGCSNPFPTKLGPRPALLIDKNIQINRKNSLSKARDIPNKPMDLSPSMPHIVPNQYGFEGIELYGFLFWQNRE